MDTLRKALCIYVNYCQVLSISQLYNWYSLEVIEACSKSHKSTKGPEIKKKKDWEARKKDW